MGRGRAGAIGAGELVPCAAIQRRGTSRSSEDGSPATSLPPSRCTVQSLGPFSLISPYRIQTHPHTSLCYTSTYKCRSAVFLSNKPTSSDSRPLLYKILSRKENQKEQNDEYISIRRRRKRGIQQTQAIPCYPKWPQVRHGHGGAGSCHLQLQLWYCTCPALAFVQFFRCFAC